MEASMNGEMPMPEKEFSGTPGKGGKYTSAYKRALAHWALEKQYSPKEVHAVTGVSPGAVSKWCKKYARSFNMAQRSNGMSSFKQSFNEVAKESTNGIYSYTAPGTKKSYTPEFKNYCLNWMRENPRAKLCDAVETLKVSSATLSRWRTEMRLQQGAPITVPARVPFLTPATNKFDYDVNSRPEFRSEKLNNIETVKSLLTTALEMLKHV